MIITEKKYPFLKFVKNNRLKIDDSVFSEIEDFPEGIEKAKKILGHFAGKAISVFYITETTHDKLQKTDSFANEKQSLYEIPESVGLILLPESLTPVVTESDFDWRTQDLKMNSILFSFLHASSLDTIEKGEPQRFDRDDFDDDEDYNWEINQYETGRWLHFLPIQLNKFFHVENNGLEAVAEEFATRYDQYGRRVYGNVIDYLLSFLLLLNAKSTEVKIIDAIDPSTNYRISNDQETILNETANIVTLINQQKEILAK